MVTQAKRLREKQTASRSKLAACCLFLLCSIFSILLSYSCGTDRQPADIPPQETEQPTLNANAANGETLEFGGKTYRLKPGLTAILFLGIDRNIEKDEQEISARDGGQSDFLALVIIDSLNETITRLQIDRDTMAEVTVLGVLGNETGTKQLQICLAHGYGDGREQSCEFSVESVQKLLFNVKIDEYLALNLAGIGALNDALGGVTVPIENDFSFYDATMIKGTTMQLTAQQAEYYVRKRAQIDEGTNESRMRRQSVYIKNAFQQAQERIEGDVQYANTLFNALEPYVTTSMSRGRIINLLNNVKEYSFVSDPLKIPGEYTRGKDGFIEFHADEDGLRQLVIQTFYEPVN